MANFFIRLNHHGNLCWTHNVVWNRLFSEFPLKIDWKRYIFTHKQCLRWGVCAVKLCLVVAVLCDQSSPVWSGLSRRGYYRSLVVSSCCLLRYNFVNLGCVSMHSHLTCCLMPVLSEMWLLGFLQFVWALHSLTLSWIYWTTYSWEDCDIVWTHTWMLRTRKLPERRVL